jgi:hypothetical protein
MQATTGCIHVWEREYIFRYAICQRILTGSGRKRNLFSRVRARILQHLTWKRSATNLIVCKSRAWMTISAEHSWSQDGTPPRDISSQPNIWSVMNSSLGCMKCTRVFWGLQLNPSFQSPIQKCFISLGEAMNLRCPSSKCDQRKIYPSAIR